MFETIINSKAIITPHGVGPLFLSTKIVGSDIPPISEEVCLLLILSSGNGVNKLEFIRYLIII